MADTVNNAIEAFLLSNWSSYTPIYFENGTVPVKEDSNGNPTSWIAVEIKETNFGQQSIGAGVPISSNRWDEEGQLWIHIFVPRGSGRGVAGSYRRQLVTLFRGVTLLSGALEFLDANTSGQSGDEEGNWYVLSTAIDWRWIDAQ